MTEPTSSDLRAAAALLDLIDRVEADELHAARTGGAPHRPTRWLALRLLVQAVPPDRRLQTIDQAVQFADPELMQADWFVQAVETWTAQDANAFLTHITDLTRQRAQHVFTADPQRLQGYHSHLRRSSAPDLLTEQNDARADEE